MCKDSETAWLPSVAKSASPKFEHHDLFPYSLCTAAREPLWQQVKQHMLFLLLDLCSVVLTVRMAAVPILEVNSASYSFVSDITFSLAFVELLHVIFPFGKPDFYGCCP